MNRLEADKLYLAKRKRENFICKCVLQAVALIGGGIAIMMILG